MVYSSGANVRNGLNVRVRTSVSHRAYLVFENHYEELKRFGKTGLSRSDLIR